MIDERGGVPLMQAPDPRAMADTGPLQRAADPSAPWQQQMAYRPPVRTVAHAASFGIRLLAKLVDLAVVALLTALGYGALFGVLLAVGGLHVSGLLYALLVWTLLPLAAWLLYRVLGEGNATGQTLGKSVCGIRVIRVDPPVQRRPGLGRALIRALVSALNAFFCIADLAMLFAPDRRTLGDKASGTAVVHTEAQPLGAFGSAAVAGLLVCALAVPVAVLGHGLSGHTGDQAGGSLGTVVVQPDSATGRTLGSVPDAPIKSGITDNAVGTSGDLGPSAFSVQVPTQAANGQDAGGNPTNYSGSNMLDGDPGTCWRMDGDGTGDSVTVDLGATRQITSVGMTNGYAKADPYTGEDRYSQERRITDVTWTFDDGTAYTQTLDANYPDTQSINLPAPVSSRTVTVRLDYVTSPGDFDFDYTAISDLSIRGS